jgi:hypothetical protein
MKSKKEKNRNKTCIKKSKKSYKKVCKRLNKEKFKEKKRFSIRINSSIK